MYTKRATIVIKAESINDFRKKKTSKLQSMKSFCDTVTPNDKQKIDGALAKFFFGCNIPFSVVESLNFKAFLKILRPSYDSPCRKTLATTLLEKTNAEMIDLNKTIVPKFTALLIDGWKNSAKNSKNVVTMLQTADGNSCFLESYDFSESSETGEALAEVCKKSVELAKQRYGTTVYAVVSDNAANMIKMGRLIDVWHTTCNSHTGNLLVKDIVDKDVIQSASTILKEFKHSDLESLLIKSGGTRIMLPAETRWCSQRDSLRCLIRNMQQMKRIIADGKKVRSCSNL